MKGTLASISSNDEKEHLYNMLDGKEKAWIGVMGEQWVDNAYWDFSKYFPDSDEEKDSENGEHVVITDKMWSKVSAWYYYRYICQTYSM